MLFLISGADALELQYCLLAARMFGIMVGVMYVLPRLQANRSPAHYEPPKQKFR